MAGARVLVIDDHPVIRSALSRWLAPYASSVDTAATFDDALQRLTHDSVYDHILCDLVMPGVSCDVFFEQLAERAPEHAQRLIFMTAGASEPLLDFVRRTGRPLLTKPFDMDALVELILDVRAAS